MCEYIIRDNTDNINKGEIDLRKLKKSNDINFNNIQYLNDTAQIITIFHFGYCVHVFLGHRKIVYKVIGSMNN